MNQVYLVNSYKFSYVKNEEDFYNYITLIKTTWPEENVDKIAIRLMNTIPNFNYKNIYTIKKENQIIASLTLIPQKWSFGGIPIKVAEMGLVATLPQYRNLGLQRILNKKYDETLIKENYDLSVIEGIPYFYRQFGYEYTIPLDSEINIPLKFLPDTNSQYSIKKIELIDIPKIIKLNDITKEKFFINSIRSNEVWKKQEENGWQADWPFKTYLLLEKGIIKAYLRAEIVNNKLVLIEISNTKSNESRNICGFLKKIGLENNVDELVCRINHHEFFSNYLVKNGGKKNKPYAWQVKVVNYFNFFKKIIPILNNRLYTSSYNFLESELKINFFKNSIILNFFNGQINDVKEDKGIKRSEIQFNPIVFPKILFGCASHKELTQNYPDISINSKYQELIKTLFPKFKSNIYPCY